MISIYAPKEESGDISYTVYHHKIRRSDQRDPLEYGQDFDISKTFTEQLGELMMRVPRTSIHVIGNENCDYLNQCGYSKNCYLSFNTDFSQDCLYTKDCDRCESCIDCLNVKQSND